MQTSKFLILIFVSLVKPTATREPTIAAPKAERINPRPILEETRDTRSCLSVRTSYVNYKIVLKH